MKKSKKASHALVLSMILILALSVNALAVDFLEGASRTHTLSEPANILFVIISDTTPAAFPLLRKYRAIRSLPPEIWEYTPCFRMSVIFSF